MIPVERIRNVPGLVAGQVSRVVVARSSRKAFTIPEMHLKETASYFDGMIWIGHVVCADEFSEFLLRIEDLAGHDLHETCGAGRACDRGLNFLVVALVARLLRHDRKDVAGGQKRTAWGAGRLALLQAFFGPDSRPLSNDTFPVFPGLFEELLTGRIGKWEAHTFHFDPEIRESSESGPPTLVCNPSHKITKPAAGLCSNTDLDILWEMLRHKAFKYRTYPTKEQVSRLSRWEDSLRFLWNLANEQRLAGCGRLKGERVYPTAFDQINELTDLRKELPWLAEVPRNVSAQLLVELDKAWQRCFKKLSSKPRWKRKGLDSVNFTEPSPKMWRREGDSVRFPKLGNLRTVFHREIEGMPKRCTLSRDGDQWFVSILCEIEGPDPVSREQPVVAIDRGITQLLADSDGNLTANPRFYERAMARLARAQRVVCRRQKGSARLEKAKMRVMRMQRKVRRQREHFLHVESSRLSKSHGTVVIENLNVKGMMGSRLGRSIADAGWSRFAEMLRYKLAWSGGQLVEVPAHYSSQTCAVCWHIDAASRKGARFCCTGCCNEDHADLNAAKVLKSRANRSVLPVEGCPPEGPLRSGKLSVKLRVPRREAVETPAS